MSPWGKAYLETAGIDAAGNFAPGFSCVRPYFQVFADYLVRLQFMSDPEWPMWPYTRPS